MPWPYQMPEKHDTQNIFYRILGSKRSLVIKFDQFM